MTVKNSLDHRILTLVCVMVAVFPLIFLFSSPSDADENRWTTRFETIARALEREAADGLTLPIYEYINIDYTQPDMTGLALHLYGWGRLALNEGNDDTNNPDGELLFGYVSYKFAESDLQAQLGRIEMFNRLSSEAFDGVRVTMPLWSFLDAEVFGGSPISKDADGIEAGSLIYGGSLTHRIDNLYHLTLGYKQVAYDTLDDGETLTVNFGFQPFSSLYFTGRSTYNLTSQGWPEHSYQLTVLAGDLSIEPYYQRFQFDDLFGEKNSVPSPFRAFADIGDVLDVVGGKIDWTASTHISTGLTIEKYGHSENDINALSSQLRLLWQLSSNLQVGTDLGVVDGDTARTGYRQGRIFFHLAQIPLYGMVLYFSGDLLLANYDEAFNGEDRSIDVTGSVGSHFLNDKLELKLAAEYSENPYFLEDFRGTFILIYNIGN